ncbi:DUF58 domain-containing protein [Methylobacterium terricola]|uniref:DUF58 domain-containing protein n=1 Tax=Methylobacterium terricola TaxID=2583531 RepID=A0A5C4LI94_9HYPH|nr:DUF58 domain-containing protein [Methylobacterium terricola]TNC14033.1 DUF58 domain-containing protein [Methylobacterium terricola]
MTGDILYRLRGPAAGSGAGAHRSRDTGGIGVFRDHVPFWRHPDARRIDLRATLRDPFEGTVVRRFEQSRALEVWALVDLSASMRFRGAGATWDLVTELCIALARSATRIGDAFGLIGCGAGPELVLPASRRRGTADAVAARLRAMAPGGASADGLLAAATSLAGRRKLVVVVSDFRLPEALTGAVFERLQGHDVVPVAIEDGALGEGLPAFGLIELEDLEGGGRRRVLMRPSLRARWLAREAERRDFLRRLALRHGRPPYRLADRFDGDDFSRHLLGTAA